LKRHYEYKTILAAGSFGINCGTIYHMSQTRVLAISSSRVGNSGYLEMAAPLINNFLGEKSLNIAFIPFAAADSNYPAYEARVKEALQNLPYNINVVVPGSAETAIEEADVIMVGGGNTFKLLHDIYDLHLPEIIKSKLNAGIPYVGWSAGANITGLTIGTTNDMPIIEPASFKALELFPFQINPHYYNQVTEGFNGETRDQRLEEYLLVNSERVIIGLPEGTVLQLSDRALTYLGSEPAALFSREKDESVTRRELLNGTDLSWLMELKGNS
jgi:dipeptidase E